MVALFLWRMSARRVARLETASVIHKGPAVVQPKLLIGLGLAIYVAGCSAHTAQVASPAQPAPLTMPAQEIHTTLSPADAADAASKIYAQAFEFVTTDSSGYLHTEINQNGQHYAYVKASDYFHAQVEAVTAAGHQVSTSCEWVRDGETVVTIQSDLPAAELQRVLERLREVLVVPASTQPTIAP
jgi:hypothetical protein